MLELKRLRQDLQGISTTEYTILLVLIGVAGIGVWMEFGTALKRLISGE